MHGGRGYGEHLDSGHENRRRAVLVGAPMPKEMPGLAGAAGEKVKEHGENVYLKVQAREHAMRKELARYRMQETAIDAMMVRIRGAESNNLVNKSKEEAAAIAAAYAELAGYSADDGLRAAAK